MPQYVPNSPNIVAMKKEYLPLEDYFPFKCSKGSDANNYHVKLTNPVRNKYEFSERNVANYCFCSNVSNNPAIDGCFVEQVESQDQEQPQYLLFLFQHKFTISSTEVSAKAVKNFIENMEKFLEQVTIYNPKSSFLLQRLKYHTIFIVIWSLQTITDEKKQELETELGKPLRGVTIQVVICNSQRILKAFGLTFAPLIRFFQGKPVLSDASGSTPPIINNYHLRTNKKNDARDNIVIFGTDCLVFLARARWAKRTEFVNKESKEDK